MKSEILILNFKTGTGKKTQRASFKIIILKLI